MISFVERKRTGTNHRPAALRGCLQEGAAFPGQIATRLASGVGQLDTGHSAFSMQKAGDACQRFGVPVVPDAHIARRDTAIARHRRGLDHDQSGAADGSTAQMDEMPVVGQALLGAVLTHRGHRDPVAEGDAADSQGT
jgi:hypothetical protein